jgi:Bacteriophage probable baseplate hub protein
MPSADLSNPVVPEFSVLINGVALDATERSYISSIVVDDSLAWPSMFALQFASSFELPNVHHWIDYRDFSVGNKVEIKLGYGDKVESLISGEITGLEPEFALDRPPNLTVRGYDPRYRLQKGRRTRTFVGLSDSEIAEQIAREANLNVKATGTRFAHDYVIQANQTDLEFLRERARRIQYEVYVSDLTLYFRPVQNDESEALTMTIGDHLLEFYPRLSMIRQVDDVVVLGWHGLEKKEIVGFPETRFESAQMGGKRSGPQINTEVGRARDVLSMQPVMSQAEADHLAQATLSQKALTLIEGEGTCLGRTDVRAGKVIKLEGIGQRFSGQYYVTSAIHSYTAQGGYRTQFQVRRNSS